MSRKGSSRHLNRMASSRYMRLMKKGSKYVAKPMLGRHTLESSIALVTLLKEKMGLGNGTYEIKRIVKEGKVKVNGKVIRNERYAVGLEDIIEIAPGSEMYRVGAGGGGSVKVEKTDNGTRTLKIVGKYIYKGNKSMLALHDGTRITYVKGADVNDSVQLNGRKIEKVIKLEKGAQCRIISGMHSSESGKILEIRKGSSSREPVVEIQAGDGTIETVLRNIIVTGA